MSDTRRLLAKIPWIWSIFAASLLFGLNAALSNSDALTSILVTSLQFGTFFMIVSFGQMLVIATGPGNIDLSVPATITLSGYMSLLVMGPLGAGIFAGIATAIGAGVAIGLVNFTVISRLRVPPIIATMALSNIYMSLAFNVGGERRVAPPAPLVHFVQAKIAMVPLLALVALFLTLAISLLLRRATLGRAILAVGQNERAAYLTGVDARATRRFVYVICAVLASISGMLLAAFSGGASLDMGEEYLLMSVAIVVLGGSSITGGRANTIGIWGATLFMYFLATLSNSLGWGQGMRLVASGLVIILVTLVAAEREQR